MKIIAKDQRKELVKYMKEARKKGHDAKIEYNSLGQMREMKTEIINKVDKNYKEKEKRNTKV